ncbi:MAG: hypothetical protein ACR2PL_11120 [Dehalococcoidia bacterium]
MRNGRRFAYTPADSMVGEASLLPLLPLVLHYQGCSTSATGLLDTGATVNVLPYPLGVELGAVWEGQTVSVQLTGNLARYEARALLVSAEVGRFPPVPVVFAWTRAEAIPLILGQVNFFMEFDVCFYRSQLAFEVRPKAGARG